VDLNLTLFGQMITFALFIWFTKRFVWPVLIKAINDREAKIADGLAAAERGRHELDLSQERAKELLHDAKAKAIDVVDQAHKQATHILEEARAEARVLAERMVSVAEEEIMQAKHAAKIALQKELGMMVVKGAERILKQNINGAVNDRLISDLIAEVGVSE
jgi:F-type H+-transporting ATPase subunit b